MTDHQALVDELRAMTEVVRTADVDQAADAGVDVAAMVGAIRLGRTALEDHVVDDVRMQAGLRAVDRPGATPGTLPDLTGITPEDFFPYSPVIGPLNPIAPPFRFWMEGDEVHGEGRFGAAFNGPPGGVHGGLVAALMDEVLGVTGVMTGNHGFTGTLSIRYESLTPVDTDLTVRGWVEGTEGRKAFISGEVCADGHVCARAHGVFIQPKVDDAG
ncbi:MAG: PaaI family thioesterase [Actinomycetota bacterium]